MIGLQARKELASHRGLHRPFACSCSLVGPHGNVQEHAHGYVAQHEHLQAPVYWTAASRAVVQKPCMKQATFTDALLSPPTQQDASAGHMVL